MIKDNLDEVRRRIASASFSVSRCPDDIRLVCVTKNIDVPRIKEVIGCGVRDIGENRIQEAKGKFELLSGYGLTWHLVGHLQRNKVKDAVRMFDLIQSVDSLRLAQEINKQAQKMGKVVDILIQVNTTKEVSKFGISPDESFNLLKEILTFKNLRPRGLMTIAPVVERPQEARPCFRVLKGLLERLNRLLRNHLSSPLETLSMGMSGDFEVAIQEGSNMVRIGRAIFGQRD
jgi:hypothetical protein